MKAFTFRVAAEGQDDVYRDIQISENSTFEDLHYAILKAYKIKAGEMASFYPSDEKFNREDEEITLIDMSESDEDPNVLMSDLTLGESVASGNEYFSYVYDFLFCKNFEIELLETENNASIKEAKVVESLGVYQEDLSAYADLLLDDEDDDFSGPGSKKKKDIMDDFDDFNDIQEDEDELDDLNSFDQDERHNRYDDDY